jgi:competence protein ComEA
MILRTLAALALVPLLVAPADLEAATRTATAAQEPSAKIDLNSASVETLQTLPGVGPRTAERIVEYRDSNGPFQKIEELMNVSGIGEKSFLRLRELIVVVPPKREQVSS